MKKINIGAGAFWRSDGWETLDNAPVHILINGSTMVNVGILSLNQIHMKLFLLVIP